VKRIVVVTDEPDKYPLGYAWAPGITVEHRDELDRVQRDLREAEGVTVLLYDQTCAAEKRRRRKRGTFPDPAKRIFINDLVCEGCGDCSVKSNCVSVVPLETEFGTKRAIDQSSCNKDFSCVSGFCPSFVTVHGGKLRKTQAAAPAGDSGPAWPELPLPSLPALDKPYNVLVTGVGGTGVVTIGALLGMAAHIEDKGCSVLDMTGLAQKGGAVLSHVRIAHTPEEIHAVRISAGAAHLMLACDLVVAGGFDALSKVGEKQTHAVVNTHETVTSSFVRDSAHYKFPGQALQELIAEATGKENCNFVEASGIATRLLGDSIATNLFMLGYAWQKGLVPLSLDSLNKAIDLNAVAVDFNKQAFLWGRRAAHDQAAVEMAARPPEKKVAPENRPSESLEETIERRRAFLTDYQNAAYATRYTDLVARVRQAEQVKAPGASGLGEAVARYAFKLMAYKDEYEVARLYTAPSFRQKLAAQFEGDFKLSFHLAPPLLAARDPQSGHLKKREYGAWMMKAYRVLAKLRGLRGTPLDIFGYSAERKLERQLIADYVALLEEILGRLNHDNHALAVQLASLPDEIRGYGHIKEGNIERAKKREAELLAALRSGQPQASAAE
jgi:indolepyruvate ferredoxin oxidoreductase